MAWLNAAPKVEGCKAKPLSRLSQIKKNGGLPHYPPIQTRQHIEYLFEVGPVQSGGMGQAPVSFLELQAWQDGVGIELAPWEVRLLRRLSTEYLSESIRAEEEGVQAPYKPASAAEQRAVTAQNMRAAFAAMAKK